MQVTIEIEDFDLRHNTRSIIVELVNEIRNGNFEHKIFRIFGNNFKKYEMLTNRDIRTMVVKEYVIKIDYKYGDSNPKTVVINNDDVTGFELESYK
ncbi:MAG: hypothetical protein IKG40_02010 [Bacilli bacterium]|nr:hypothetical protein [Bacilli bacterium]